VCVLSVMGSVGVLPSNIESTDVDLYSKAGQSVSKVRTLVYKIYTHLQFTSVCQQFIYGKAFALAVSELMHSL